MPISIEDYLPPSIVSRRLKGKQPTVDLMVGYHKANASPILKMFLSQLDASRSAARAPADDAALAAARHGSVTQLI